MTSLREKDRVVLTCIGNGKDDVQKITAATTLENHHVTYAFEKLEEQGLIHVEKPDGMVERVIDGQKRVFQAPKQAELTEKGRERLEKEEEDLYEYENLTHRELVEKAHQLENEFESLERQFKMFRKQVRKKWQSDE
jgi:predicted transcriptional regulator